MSYTLFFGCWGDAGHFLWDKNKQRIYDRDSYGLSAHNLDASSLILPYPEQKGKGCRTYLPSMDRTIIAWWGNPWDTRPGVNNSVIAKGNSTISEIWTAFRIDFPDLAKLWKIQEQEDSNFFIVSYQGENNA
jgi:hypothetical protein